MIDNYILFSNIPSIDLHGEDRYNAVIKTREFIFDNVKLKNKLVKVIHGKGEGILREEIHKYLKSSHYVKDYKIDVFNSGTTIVELY